MLRDYQFTAETTFAQTTASEQGRGYGKLPPRHAAIAPWNEVCVDLIGPWEIVVNGNICEFKALTCIDSVTNIVKLIRITNKMMRHVAEQFKNF